jgi:hypothetical protein
MANHVEDPRPVLVAVTTHPEVELVRDAHLPAVCPVPLSPVVLERRHLTVAVLSSQRPGRGLSGQAPATDGMADTFSDQRRALPCSVASDEQARAGERREAWIERGHDPGVHL